MNRSNKLRTLFILICVLLISQIIWWIIFNHQQNETNLSQMKKDLKLREVILNNLSDSLININSISYIGMLNHDSLIHEDEAYLDFLEAETERKNIMFISESLFVMIMVILGIFLVYRSFREELKMSLQQQNFLLSITHELKTPISSIKLLLQTLSKKNLNEEKKTEFIKESIDEIERLNTLVSNIIHTTKAETQLVPINVKSIHIRSFIDTFISNHVKNTTVEAKIESEQDYTIQMNEDDLYLVISNLVSNTITYCDEEKCKIKISIKEIKKSIELSIADNGIGIPVNERNEIFKRFYRIGSEDTRKYSGTGIGLYIVRLILKKYKSTITCINNEPKGSIFTIIFPKGS